MNFNVREFLDILIKAPTLFVYSIFKWSQKIDPHKMFITCIMQEILIILFFVIYATTPGFNTVGIAVFVISIILSIAINYVFVLGMPSDKDYWRYIITGTLTEDLFRRATKSKSMSSKLGVAYTRGNKKKITKQEDTKEEYKYEEEYQGTVTDQNNYDGNIDNSVVESTDEIIPKINIIDSEDSVEERECSIYEQTFNNESCEEHEYTEECSNEDNGILEVEQNTQVSEEVSNNVQEEQVVNNIQEEEAVIITTVNSEYEVEEESIKDFSENIEQKLMDNIGRTSKLAGIINDIPNISVDGYDNNLVDDDYEI